MGGAAPKGQKNSPQNFASPVPCFPPALLLFSLPDPPPGLSSLVSTPLLLQHLLVLFCLLEAQHPDPAQMLCSEQPSPALSLSGRSSATGSAPEAPCHCIQLFSCQVAIIHSHKSAPAQALRNLDQFPSHRLGLRTCPKDGSWWVPPPLLSH